MKYSILDKNNNVINIINADNQFLVDSGMKKISVIAGNSAIGDIYDPIKDTFTAPTTKFTPKFPSPPPITKLDFMNRFTDAELAAIFTAAKTDVAVEVWVEKLKAATEVKLDDPKTITGVNALETLKLIAVGRAKVILA